MGQKSSLYRTVEILKRADEGKKLCIERLALEYEVSERTIRRDFELIRELFGDFIHKEGSCYQAYKKALLEEVLSATDLMTLANIVNLFGVTSMQSSISEKTEALIKESLSVYDFKSRPFENLQNRDIVKKLEHAIKFSKEIKIIYTVSRGTLQRKFHPYKILFLNENFYLVGENRTKNVFEFLRISLIAEIKETKKVFHPHFEITEFIETIQTPWATFGKESVEVRLRVNRKVRKYFQFKKYLPSQRIVHTFEDGDLEIHYSVSNIKEIEELFIKWLPHVSVIAPRGLKKMVKRTLKKKLSGLE